MPDLPSPLKQLLRVRPTEVELLRPRAGVPPLSALLLAASAVAVLGAAMVCRPAWERSAELAADEARLQSAVDRLGADSPAGRSRTSAAGKSAQADALAEAELVVAESHRPWHALFDQLEAAQKSEGAGVHLVQLAIDPRFATVQLVAEGRDLGKLVRFAQQLPGTGPIRTMSLSHHEWRDTLGAHVVTASLQGELDSSGPAVEPPGVAP
jgi:hypothetical protein